MPLIDHSEVFLPSSKVPLQISSRMLLNLPVFQTSADTSSRPASFPLGIFWSTFWSSSLVKGPFSIGRVVWAIFLISSSGLLVIGGEPRSDEKYFCHSSGCSPFQSSRLRGRSLCHIRDRHYKAYHRIRYTACAQHVPVHYFSFLFKISKRVSCIYSTNHKRRIREAEN